MTKTNIARKHNQRHSKPRKAMPATSLEFVTFTPDEPSIGIQGQQSSVTVMTDDKLMFEDDDVRESFENEFKKLLATYTETGKAYTRREIDAEDEAEFVQEMNEAALDHPETATAVVGMAATIGFSGGDRFAATVIAVSPSGRKVTVQEDKSIRTDDRGMSEHQDWKHERDPSGQLYTCYRHADGYYRSGGKRLTLGVRSRYYNFSL